MQGTVTYFDKENLKGAIQSDNGQLLSFDDSSLDNETKVGNLSVDMRVGFEINEDDTVTGLCILKDQIIIEDKIFYEAPSRVGFAKGVPDGFELIDSDDLRLEVEARNTKQAKAMLVSIAKSVGANLVMDYKEEQFVRNSIGFSYYMYRASARFGLIAKKTDDNSKDVKKVSLYDLKHTLSHEIIAKNYSDNKKSKKGIFLLKVLGALLVMVFFIGFLIS